MHKNVLLFILTPLVKFTAIFVETFNNYECLVIVNVMLVRVMNNQLSHIFSSYVDSEAQDTLSLYNILSLINTQIV